MDEDTAARARIAYTESVRGLDMQSGLVAQLHSRTGTVVSAIALASSFLGAVALKHHHVLYWASLCGLVSLLVAIATAVAVLWPTEDWEFVHEIGPLLDATDDETTMLRRMAMGNAESWHSNDARLKVQFKLFRIACGALGANLLFWLLDVGIR
jgi:hypothetical protein